MLEVTEERQRFRPNHFSPLPTPVPSSASRSPSGLSAWECTKQLVERERMIKFNVLRKIPSHLRDDAGKTTRTREKNQHQGMGKKLILKRPPTCRNPSL
jgi:hypothetical protein